MLGLPRFRLKRRLVLGCILVLLVIAGYGPTTTPSLTAVVPLSPTPAPPKPAVPTAALPRPATALPVPADTRFGAVRFTATLNDPDLPCADLQEMGIHSTFFGAWWGLIEPQSGQYDWSSVDESVDAALACDVEPVIKITTAAGPGHDGAPPQDMGAYARFVFDLAQHLQGRVRMYAIENEIDNPRMVWTAETYGPLRTAAYKAIKEADPNAIMFDNGFTEGAYIMHRANRLYQAGQVQAALAMLDRFETYMRHKPYELPDTEEELVAWLGQANAQRSISLVDELYGHPETWDAVQLHFLQGAWELTPEFVGWIKDLLIEAGVPERSFEFWEIRYGWDGEEFTEEDHAAGVVKQLVIAFGSGAGRIIYEPYSEPWEPIWGHGLVGAEGPRLAATAYRTMASQLCDYWAVEPLGLGAGVWAYRFVTHRGDVYVVWAEESTTVRLPLDAAQVTVTDITGGTTTADPAALPVGASPIFINLHTIYLPLVIRH